MAVLLNALWAILFIYVYRVTIQLVQNLPLTSKKKFCFGLSWPGQSGTFVNRRFCTRCSVIVYKC